MKEEKKMANKYDKHITGDKWKWAVAFILIFVLLAGFVFVILQSFTPYKPLDWFKKKDDAQTVEEGRDIPPVTDGEGNELATDGTEQAMPTRMIFYGAQPMSAVATAEGEEAETTTVRLTATVTPSSFPTTNANTRWSAAFENADSEWATGKNVGDYLTVMPANSEGVAADVTQKAAFAEKIVITFEIVQNDLPVPVSATCVCDFKSVITGIELTYDQHVPSSQPTAETKTLEAGQSISLQLGYRTSYSQYSSSSTVAFKGYTYSTDTYTVREEVSNYVSHPNGYIANLKYESEFRSAFAANFDYTQAHKGIYERLGNAIESLTSLNVRYSGNDIFRMPFSSYKTTKPAVYADIVNGMINPIYQAFDRYNYGNPFSFCYYEIDVYGADSSKMFTCKVNMTVMRADLTQIASSASISEENHVFS